MSGERGAAGLAVRAPLAAAAIALLAYLPSVGGEFLYDDVHVVVENRAIRDIGDLGTVLRADPARPLLALTWAANYALAGLTPWPYHLANVLIHAGNAGLVASLFLWMARRGGRGETEALAGAAFFAATPMAAETIAYVSSRSTALAALLALASLRTAVGALEAGSTRRLALSLLLYGAALATKEEAAAVPLLLLLLDYFFLSGRSARATAARLPRHLPFLLLPVLGLAARRAVTGAWLPPPALETSRYLATQAAVFPLYLLRALVPADPAFYRHHPASPWPPDAATLLGWLASAGAFGSAVALRHRRPEWAFGVLWLAAGLLPSSSLVALKEMVVDHRAYLGGAGVAFLAGGWLFRVGRARLVAAVVVVLAARAVHYQMILGDPVRAWEDAIRRAPASAEAHRALGEAYASRGDPRAEAVLLRAVDLDPRDARSFVNLGVLYLQSGRMEEAAAAMKRAAEIAPSHARIRDNLGMVLQALGREDEALAEYEAAVAADASLAQPRINLAALLLKRGDAAGARALLDEAARLEIDAVDARAIEDLRARLPP